MDYREISGKRIARARKAAGLTQAALAEKLPGVSAARIGNYEQGTRYPDPPTFAALARILGEPAVWLMAVEEDEELIALSRKYTRMDRRGKDTMQRVADTQPDPHQEPEEAAGNK
jgi:transcriptional regulator with XRE-family HTH domain